MKKRVLIVEDLRVHQKIASMLLDALGYESVTCSNGEEALHQLGLYDFDLVLLDCHMPVMNGFECVRIIRRKEESLATRIPVIALTSDDSDGCRERCLEAGMDDYLYKPYPLYALKDVVQYWLKKAA